MRLRAVAVALVVAAPLLALESTPAAAFGWCDWGWGSTSTSTAPRSYGYYGYAAPRTYGDYGYAPRYYGGYYRPRLGLRWGWRGYGYRGWRGAGFYGQRVGWRGYGYRAGWRGARISGYRAGLRVGRRW